MFLKLDYQLSLTALKKNNKVSSEDPPSDPGVEKYSHTAVSESILTSMPHLLSPNFKAK